MGLFTSGVEAASPLLLQITAGISSLTVTRLDLCGANALGSTSRPVLYRPAITGIPGAFSDLPVTSLSGTGPGQGRVFSSFSIPPTIPTLATSSTKVPLQILWQETPFEGGFTINPGESLVLYANTAGGHAWTANITWREAE